MQTKELRTWIELSRTAILHNVKTIAKRIGSETQLGVAVKANAYGHGADLVVPIARQGGASWFLVDSLDEALAIESLIDNAPVLIMGYTPRARLAEIVTHGFRTVVYNRETIKDLGRIARQQEKNTYLHLKCETGTARQGILPEEMVSYAKLIGSFPQLILEGLSTHFANVEDTKDRSFADTQFLRFNRMDGMLRRVGIRVPIRHAASTAAALLYPEMRLTMARVGIGLYGIWPSVDVERAMKRVGVSLEPVLTWKTRVAQVKSLPKRTPVSYGLTERLTRDSRIAVIPIGYADGFDRGLSSIGEVLVRGRRARVVGRVCMNMCMVDVTRISGVRAEDEVVIIGTQGREQISATEIADRIGTIPYEITTRIPSTLPRIIR